VSPGGDEGQKPPPPEPEAPGLFEQIKATRDAAKQLVKSHVELAKAEFADITDAIKRAAILVGVAMGLGSRPVRALTVVMSRWVAGFPYLVLAIVLITALSTWSPFGAFVIAMAMVGWRDIAQLTSERVEAVLSQPYAEAATALGSGRVRTFRRHVVPHLRPVLITEIAFQASAVLVLLGELGYLKFFLGTPFTFNQILLPQPELGALLSIARDYIISEQWTPVLAPAGAIALLALAFELLGLALRNRLALHTRGRTA